LAFFEDTYVFVGIESNDIRFCNIVKISRDFEYYKYTVTTKADGTIELISEKLDQKSENNST